MNLVTGFRGVEVLATVVLPQAVSTAVFCFPYQSNDSTNADNWVEFHIKTNHGTAVTEVIAEPRLCAYSHGECYDMVCGMPYSRTFRPGDELRFNLVYCSVDFRERA